MEITDKSQIKLIKMDTFSAENILLESNPAIWELTNQNETIPTDKLPTFYPIYKYKHFYSYLPLYLIIFKNQLKLNQKFISERDPAITHNTTNLTIDSEIERVGRYLDFKNTIKNKKELIEKLSISLPKDIDKVESKFPGHKNIILCGGLDSLILTLLPWKNETLIYSAPPNYSLVKDFVTKNNLPYQVFALEDDDKSLLETEVVYNTALANLEHYRWTAHLKKIASEHNSEVLIWKGQLADVVFTPYWRRIFITKGYFSNKFNRRVKPFFIKAGSNLGLLPQDYAEKMLAHTLWHRSAMMQGFHLGFIKGICNVPVISGYHGDETQKVIESIDFNSTIKADIRKELAEVIADRKLHFPESNPSPPLSEHKVGISTVDRFIETFKKTGVPIS